MDIGYVILLLLGLVYCATAIFLYLRAWQAKPRPEAGRDSRGASTTEPEAP